MLICFLIRKIFAHYLHKVVENLLIFCAFLKLSIVLFILYGLIFWALSFHIDFMFFKSAQNISCGRMDRKMYVIFASGLLCITMASKYIILLFTNIVLLSIQVY